MALKSTITAPPVIEGVTQVNSNGDTIIANPVVFVDSQGEFITLSNGKIPVEVGSLNVSLGDATLEIANDAGNPIPINATSLPLPSGAATSANQSTANTSLASINSKIPALGQALAASSTPVVLTASQLSTLTPLASVGITGPLPAFAATPTFNIGTISTVASEATLSALNTKLPSNLTVSATRLLVDGSGVTQPVSMIAAPPGLAYLSTATITRAANTTAYTANDVYGNGSSGNAFELTNIGPSGGFVFLSSLDIIFNITALPTGMGSFAVYLFNAPPLSAITDNLPYSLGSSDRASILTLNGLSLTASLARGGGSVVAETLNINQLFKLATGSTSIWGYLVTLSAFTPAANSETATIRARSFAP